VVRILQHSLYYHFPYQDCFHQGHEDWNHNYSYLRVIIAPEFSSLFQFFRCLIIFKFIFVIFPYICLFTLIFLLRCTRLSILGACRLSSNLVLSLTDHRWCQERYRNLYRVTYQLTIHHDRLFRQPISSNPYHFFCHRRRFP